MWLKRTSQFSTYLYDLHPVSTCILFNLFQPLVTSLLDNSFALYPPTHYLYSLDGLNDPLPLSPFISILLPISCSSSAHFPSCPCLAQRKSTKQLMQQSRPHSGCAVHPYTLYTVPMYSRCQLDCQAYKMKNVVIWYLYW